MCFQCYIFPFDIYKIKYIFLLFTQIRAKAMVALCCGKVHLIFKHLVLDAYSFGESLSQILASHVL